MHFTGIRTLLSFPDEFKQAVPKQFAMDECQPFLVMLSQKLRKCSQKRLMLRDLTSLVD